MKLALVLVSIGLSGCSLAQLSAGDPAQGELAVLACRIPTPYSTDPPLTVWVKPTCNTTDEVHLEAYDHERGEFITRPWTPEPLAGDRWHEITRYLRYLPPTGQQLRIRFRARCRRNDGQHSVRRTRAVADCIAP